MNWRLIVGTRALAPCRCRRRRHHVSSCRARLGSGQSYTCWRDWSMRDRVQGCSIRAELSTMSLSYGSTRHFARKKKKLFAKTYASWRGRRRAYETSGVLVLMWCDVSPTPGVDTSRTRGRRACLCPNGVISFEHFFLRQITFLWRNKVPKRYMVLDHRGQSTTRTMGIIFATKQFQCHQAGASIDCTVFGKMVCIQSLQFAWRTYNLKTRIRFSAVKQR